LTPKKRAMKSATSRRLRLVSASLNVSFGAAPSGCVTVGPEFRQPDVTLEDRWIESLPNNAQTAPAAQAASWTAFNDPGLTALEQRAYERNLTLQVAGLHIFKAAAQLSISEQNPLPRSGIVSVGASHIDTSGVGPIPSAHPDGRHRL
jgi:outer membrane protein TolC